MNEAVLSAYGLNAEQISIQPFGKGLINHTWKIIAQSGEYILQRINESVFKQPADIAGNIALVREYLLLHHPSYNFVSPIRTLAGQEMVAGDEGFFRLFPFVKNSHTLQVVETPAQAYEAATQFARFTRLLSGINLQKLKITIPYFHDLSRRYHQFEDSLMNGNKERIIESKKLTEMAKSNHEIVEIFEKLTQNPAVKLRVIHHDTKISNVLFDASDKGLCVIDLDTVMPGYFISDLGDMMRTYLSPVSEEEQDFAKIEIRDDFYKAIVKGYRDEMKDELSETETAHFFYAGRFMIYMQALRFLADHINNDSYYSAMYPGQNLVRAANQFTLLNRLSEKEEQFIKI